MEKVLALIERLKTELINGFNESKVLGEIYRDNLHEIYDYNYKPPAQNCRSFTYQHLPIDYKNWQPTKEINNKCKRLNELFISSKLPESVLVNLAKREAGNPGFLDNLIYNIKQGQKEYASAADYVIVLLVNLELAKEDINSNEPEEGFIKYIEAKEQSLPLLKKIKTLAKRKPTAQQNKKGVFKANPKAVYNSIIEKRCLGKVKSLAKAIKLTAEEYNISISTAKTYWTKCNK